MLTRHYVMRTKDGRYLSRTGAVTPSRASAARVSFQQGQAVVRLCVGRPGDTWGLSLEEVGKTERRLHAPMTADESTALLTGIMMRQRRARMLDLVKSIEEHERWASYYRQQLAKIEGVMLD